MFVDEFQLTVASLNEDVALVAVAGELDLYSAPRLQDGIDEATTTEARTVVVDLSAISFIDSTTLGVLVQRSKRLARDGQALAVVSNDPRTLRVFQITGLDRVLTIYPALDDALAVLVQRAVA
jgi:anti-sigma B factor antagonist